MNIMNNFYLSDKKLYEDSNWNLTQYASLSYSVGHQIQPNPEFL